MYLTSAARIGGTCLRDFTYQDYMVYYAWADEWELIRFLTVKRGSG